MACDCSGYSKLDFPTLGAQLTYWVTNVARGFLGPHPGSGENGVDIGMPHGTPVYAPISGKVLAAGFPYTGGGVVAIQKDSQHVYYIQHLDEVCIASGGQVNAGTQIGISGGQTSGGCHPATCCTNFDHIEVGINAPFGAAWGNPNGLPNYDPLPTLKALNNIYVSSATPIATIRSNGTPVSLDPSYANQGQLVSQSAPASSCSGHLFGANLPLFGNVGICIPQTIWNWVTQPIRFLKLVAGTLLVGAVVLMFAIPVVAGPALEVGGAATGQPEVVAAGHFLSSSRSRRRALRHPVSTAAKRISRNRQAKRAQQAENQSSGSGLPRETE